MPFLPTSSTPSRKTRPPKSSPIYSCLTPSWLQQILDTVDMQQPQSLLEEKSLQEKRNSYAAQQSIKILHIFMSGSLRTSIVPFATFLPQANPFLLCWSVTTQRFSRCSKEKAKSLQLFSAVRPSCIGTQLREWTRWSLLKQSRIQTTWSANIKTGHVVAIVARNNMKNKNMDDLWCFIFNETVERCYVSSLKVGYSILLAWQELLKVGIYILNYAVWKWELALSLLKSSRTLTFRSHHPQTRWRPAGSRR